MRTSKASDLSELRTQKSEFQAAEVTGNFKAGYGERRCALWGVMESSSLVGIHQVPLA